MGRGRLHAVAALALALALAPTAGAVDWSTVEGKDVTVFHTGQASWEWLLTKKDHSGGEKMREGKTCQDCHRGEEAKIGELVASGEKLEPEPGRVGRAFTTIRVQAAHDGKDLLLRFSWPAGEGAERLAVMFDDGNVKEMARGGCFATCHADLTGMPHADGAERSKYLVQSRTKIRRSGGGDALKPPAELASLLQAGNFLELWELEARRTGSAEAKDGGWVLEKRHERDAPLITVTGEREGDRSVAVLSRPLGASGKGVQTLAVGDVVTFGIALHAGDSEGRFHQVSFEHTLAIDRGEADLVARKP